MEPADRGALARVPEGLQFVVPRFAEELGDLGGQLGLAGRRAGDRGAQPVLGDEDVAVDARDGVKDPQIGVEL